MKPLALVFVGLVGITVAGFAQTPKVRSWPPTAGTRVRILSPVLGIKPEVGTVDSVAGTTLQFRRTDGSSSISLNPSEITTIEVSGGTHTAKAKWAAIGILAGAAIGGGIGSATYTPCRDSFACIGDIGGRSGSVLLGAVAGALTGGVAGALLGARRVESWIPVSR